MKLPLLLSVPHAGTRVPPEVAEQCLLDQDAVIADGDEGAAEIYALRDLAQGFVTTEIARAVVDLNRAEDDRRRDGVVKTHTCWDVPVYRGDLSEPTVSLLLERYYRPYHRKLTTLARSGVVLGVDCHTMAAVGPPVGPDRGRERPPLCLSDAGGTCPKDWFHSMAECLEAAFELEVSLNEPFRGGYIIREHARELPWMQLELSRAPLMTPPEKRACLHAALRLWCINLAEKHPN